MEINTTGLVELLTTIKDIVLKFFNSDLPEKCITWISDNLEDFVVLVRQFIAEFFAK